MPRGDGDLGVGLFLASPWPMLWLRKPLSLFQISVCKEKGNTPFPPLALQIYNHYLWDFLEFCDASYPLFPQLQLHGTLVCLKEKGGHPFSPPSPQCPY